MPDDVKTEEQTQERETETKPEEGTEAELGETQDLETEDAGEPGGKEPSDVRARKEYRARRRLEKELRERDIRLARLEGEVQATKGAAQPKPQEPEAPKYTEAEVLAWAAEDPAGRQAQAVQYLKGIKEYEQGKLKREILEEVDKRGGTKEVQQTAARELDGYISAIPSLRDVTSTEFASVKAEYDRLKDFGMKEDSLERQLVAVKAAFGPLSGLKRRSSPAFERENRGASSETNGSGSRPADGGAGGSESQVRKQIHPAQIAHWQKQGKTWDQMLKDAKYVSGRFRL